MQPRRWLPYQLLQSRHLGLALATSRVIAWIGMLLIVAGIAYGIAVAVSHPAPGTGTLVLGFVLGGIGWGLAALVLSGALAALVGIEENLRQRDGHD